MAREKAELGASELLQFGIKIEENGEKFYRETAQTIKNRELKDLLVFLADEEAEHKKVLESMIPEIEKYEPAEAYPPEYFAYLRAFADNIIFTGKLRKDLPKKMDAVSVIDFGIRRELDSIAYYQEMRGVVPREQHDMVDRIIQQEREHFMKFTNLKKTLT